MVGLLASGILTVTMWFCSREFFLYIVYGQCLQRVYVISGLCQSVYIISYYVFLNLHSAQSLPAGGGEGLSSSCPALQQQG